MDKENNNQYKANKQEGGKSMTILKKALDNSLTKDKKVLMKKLMGSASTRQISYNKIREDLRNDGN